MGGQYRRQISTGNIWRHYATYNKVSQSRQSCPSWEMLNHLSITNYLSLISFATISWTKNGSEYPNSEDISRHQWLNDLGTLINSVNPTSHQITSILSLLSGSVTQGAALPPYIQSKSSLHPVQHNKFISCNCNPIFHFYMSSFNCGSCSTWIFQSFPSFGSSW